MVVIGLDGKRTPIKTNYRNLLIRQELKDAYVSFSETTFFEHLCNLYKEKFAKPLPPIIVLFPCELKAAY
jgi:hypothetical protein